MNIKEYPVGQVLNAVSATVEEGMTKAPPSYTEASLMEDMLSAHKFAKNDQDRAVLKQVGGIGTSRTRGTVIKSFVDRGFLVRVKKNKAYQLQVSRAGQDLLALLPSCVKDVAMTAKWERALQLVADGTAKPEQLIDKVKQMLGKMVPELLPEKTSFVKTNTH